MIANSSPPRATPLTSFNSSPFSRGSRAVHQGLKRAKAVINSTKDETDIDMGLFSSKDGGNECNPDSQTKPESPTSSSCDANSLTPSSRGILKRRREAEVDSEEAVTCSKKKVIFASPISVAKIIDNVLDTKDTKATNRPIRRRKLRYEDSADETSVKDAPTGTIIELVEEESRKETPALNGTIHENSENSEPHSNTKQLQTSTRKTRSSAARAAKTSSNPSADNTVAKLENNTKDARVVEDIPKSSDIKVNVKTDHEVISQDVKEDENSDIIYENIESLLMKMESSSSSSSDTPSSVGYFKEKFVSLNSPPVEKPSDNDLPKKDTKISCLLSPSKFEFDLNCIPRLDPSQIIPKASIVIKRLTQELIYRLLGKERNQALGRAVIW